VAVGGGTEYQVRSVNRAVDILELVASRPGQTLTQLAEALEIPKSTCFTIINTLLARSLLSQDSFSGRFHLGVTTIQLGGACLRELDVRKVARPHMERLVTATRETAILAVLQEPDLSVIYIEKVDSPEVVALALELGRRVPSYCSALGKALLAHVPAHRLEQYLKSRTFKAMTPRTLTDPDELRAHLQTVRQVGYAINDLELDNEGWGIACPIFDHTGQAVAALSVAGPIYRFTPDRLEGLIEAVTVTGRQVSAGLGAVHK